MWEIAESCENEISCNFDKIAEMKTSISVSTLGAILNMRQNFLYKNPFPSNYLALFMDHGRQKIALLMNTFSSRLSPCTKMLRAIQNLRSRFFYSVKKLIHLTSSSVPDHRLNMELDLRRFLGFMCTVVLIG